MNTSVVLDGNSLSIEKVVAVARFFTPVKLDEKTFEAIDKSCALVDKILEQERTVYGISTGFGEFSKIAIGREQSALLQENLILSHCVAVGEPLSEEVVRAMMLLRANALCLGHSGIRQELIETLIAMLNAGVHPIIPCQGSLGASGDLAPLAHMALVLIGRGEAMYKGERLSGAEAMRRAGLKTFSLRAKEGLALINGTQCMTAIGSLAWYDLNRAARLCDITASMTMEAVAALTAAFDPRVHAVRPQRGQVKVAANILKLLQGSEIIESAKGMRVQDAYAIRCIPQVHGAARDAIDYARGVIEIELNSVTDNPILFCEDEAVISGGNFHGEPVALVMDFLGIAASELASISERRLERMVNPTLSNGLPAFLTPNGGVNSGFMITQYSAASLVSENKVYSHPASVDSIPSSANQEDHVSMGTTAARKLRTIVENLYSVLAFELMAAVQGIELRGGKPSRIHQSIAERVRKEVPFMDEDLEMVPFIEGMNKLIRGGEIEKLVADEIEDFE
ncbi:MAG: histidine ammonia-lyase [Clostridia bacterium]|nr:histidine ammonia-lyase [Clostridia bacterium]